VILAQELECGLHPTDGQNLSAELDKARAHVDRINGKCVVEAKRLSQLVEGISNVHVDLGMLPISDMPQLPELAQEALPTADLILKRL
jgi:hypothetical protein